MIFAPFARRNRHFAPPFLAMQGDLSFLRNLSSMAKIILSTVLGLKLDSSNTKLQTNLSCLMSRYHIWMCKLRDEIPNLTQPEKWKPLLGHF